MKTVSVGEFKSKFAYYLEMVMKGEKFVIQYGRKRIKVAQFSPYKSNKKFVRKLGPLDGKIKIQTGKDWEMTDDELLSL